MNPELATVEELLAEGFAAQADCYREAIELISGWLTDPSADLGKLVVVLEQQQRLVHQATEIDQTLLDARERWRVLSEGRAPGPRLQAALDRLRSAISELIGLNDLLRGHTLRARDEARARLDELRAADQAARAYRTQRRHPEDLASRRNKPNHPQGQL